LTGKSARTSADNEATAAVATNDLDKLGQVWTISSAVRIFKILNRIELLLQYSI